MDIHPLNPVLRDFGLPEKESLIYLATLSLGEDVVARIAKQAGIKRPTAYVILESLRKKGLVNRLTVGKKEYFRASNPNILLQDLEFRKNRLEQALPDLLKLGKRATVSPDIKIYSGASGIMQALMDSISSGKELVGWFKPSAEEDLIDAEFMPKYLAERLRRKVSIRGVMAWEDAEGFSIKDRRDKKALREIYAIPSEEFPFGSEIIIVADRVFVLSFHDSVGFLFENSHLASILRYMFEATFRYAKMREPEIMNKPPKRRSLSSRTRK